MMGTFRATVASDRKLSGTLGLLSLAVDGRAEFSFQAGQFVALPVPPPPPGAKDAPGGSPSPEGGGLASQGSKPRKGYFCVASAEQARHVDLLVEHRPDGGPVSAWVFSRSRGDELELEGPMGKFGLVAPLSQPQAFLCQAAGLAPCRSMILSSLYNGSAQPHHLFLGGEEVLEGEWRRLAAEFPQFHYHPCADPAAEAAAVLKERQGLRLYVAGFNREVEPLAAALQAAGFDPTQVKTEKFG